MKRIYTNPTASKFVEFSDRPTQTLTSEIATRAEVESMWASLYERLPNPDPVLRRTNQAIDILDEIKRNPQVSACSTGRESGTLSRKWKLEKCNASSSAVTAIELLFKRLPMRQMIQEILKAWGYGYQVTEVVWERQGNMLLPSKVIGKPNRWYFFNSANELRMRTKTNDWTGTGVEARKFLLTQYRADYDNPYGEAQYSMCFWPVSFAKGGLKDWAKFLEKFGIPHALAKVPDNTSSEDRQKVMAALTKMIRDACAVFPEGSSIELIQAANVSGSSDAFEQFARYHDGQIATIILGHSAAVTATPGKLGGDDTALNARKDIIDGDCEMVQGTINTLIQWIHEGNPALGVERPSFELYVPTEVEIERAERDSKLPSYVRLNKPYFIKKYDFAEEDIDIVEPPAPTPSAQPQPGPQFSAAPAKPSEQPEIDTLLEGITDDATLQAQADKLLQPVFDLLEKSDSFDKFRKDLAKLYPKLDTTGIEAMLEKAGLLAMVAGRATGNE